MNEKFDASMICVKAKEHIDILVSIRWSNMKIHFMTRLFHLKVALIGCVTSSQQSKHRFDSFARRPHCAPFTKQ